LAIPPVHEGGRSSDLSQSPASEHRPSALEGFGWFQTKRWRRSRIVADRNAGAGLLRPLGKYVMRAAPDRPSEI
jgi:hypothetical protein